MRSFTQTRRNTVLRRERVAIDDDCGRAITHMKTAEFPPRHGEYDEGYLTKREIAKRLHRTPRTIETWMRRGYLPYIKIGRSVLFRWADIERHFAENNRILKPLRQIS